MAFLLLYSGHVNENILIVDDERMFLLSLSEGLSAYAGDFNIITAENGRKAVEAIKSVKVDLVVTDLRMPEMDGFELLAYLSKDHPEISVLVMTTFGAPKVDDRLRALAFPVYRQAPRLQGACRQDTGGAGGRLTGLHPRHHAPRVPAARGDGEDELLPPRLGPYLPKAYLQALRVFPGLIRHPQAPICSLSVDSTAS